MEYKDFLLEDYKLKVDFFTKHFSRVWMRFNTFIVIQGALISFGLTTVFENGSKPASTEMIASAEMILFMALNIALCIIWYVFGAQDRYLTILYRKQGHEAGKACVAIFSEEGKKDYDPVGNTQNTKLSVTPKSSLIQWRLNLFSMTRLPVVVPMVFLAGWIIAAVRTLCF